MKQQRSTVKTRNQPEKRQDGDAVGRPSCRSSFLRDPGAKFLGGKLNKQKNSLNFASTCLKVVDTRRSEDRRQSRKECHKSSEHRRNYERCNSHPFRYFEVFERHKIPNTATFLPDIVFPL